MPLKGQKQVAEAPTHSKGKSINGLVNALLRTDMDLSEEDKKSTKQE